MMKFYKKKEISQEKTPILFRLERRHTLLDGGKHEAVEDESRRASRANSVGSYTHADTPQNMKRSATLSKLCLSDDNRSNFSAASVVITESELSSSWLYKSRKARIDSDEENISGSPNVPTEDNDMQPVPLHDPTLKPVSVPLKPRQEKVSSCCCYLLVAITICIASLGIMAAIGGIIYLEVFAAYKEVSEGKHASQTSLLEVSSDRNGEIDGSSQNKIRNFEENTLSASEANFNKEDLVIHKANEEMSNVGDTAQNPVLHESRKEVTNPMVGNSKSVFYPAEQFNISTALDKDLFLVEVDDLEQQGDNEWVKKSDDFTSIDLSSDAIQNIDIHGSFSNIRAAQDNNISVLQENQDEIEINGFAKDNSDFDELDPNHQTKSRFLPEIEQEISDNTLDANEDVNLNSSKPDNFPTEDVELENIFGVKSQSRNLFDNDSLEQLVMNRPIVEAKPPTEFQKRLVGNQNEDPNQSLADMDRKFSLSEILKHLRTLDVNDKLPSSRQKDVVTEMVRISSHQDIGSERKEYLNKLRRKIYD